MIELERPLVLVYAKDDEYIALSFHESVDRSSRLLRAGWKHTATIDAAAWFEVHLNDEKGFAKSSKRSVLEMKNKPFR